MQARLEEKRIAMLAGAHGDRLKTIQGRLMRGDLTRIAKKEGVTREWVTKVVNGWGSSEPILQAVERYLAERGGGN